MLRSKSFTVAFRCGGISLEHLERGTTMRTLVTFAVMVAFLAASSAEASSSATESPKTRLTIEVRDPSGAPLRDASVHVMQWRPSSEARSQLVDIATGTPDAQGIFKRFACAGPIHGVCRRDSVLFSDYRYSYATRTGPEFQVQPSCSDR